jgi:hypothetical protein
MAPRRRIDQVAREADESAPLVESGEQKELHALEVIRRAAIARSDTELRVRGASIRARFVICRL